MATTSTQRTKVVPTCNQCGKRPRLETREVIGLVGSCDCSVVTLTMTGTLPEGWR